MSGAVAASPPSTSDFYIVNSFDRPWPRHIAQARDGKLYYIHSDLRDEKQFHGMRMDEAVPIVDFGVTLSIEDRFLVGIQTAPSRAHYSDGRVREWQGNGKFRLPLLA